MKMTTEMKKRIVMTVAGVLLSGFAVGMFNASAFGMDPFQVFAHGTGRLLPVSFGTFINIFLLGYMVDFSTWVWRQTALVETIALRAVLLAAGVLLLCAASSLYYVGDLGVSTYDSIALCISEKRKLRFFLVRVSCDLIATAAGFAFGEMPGVGTLVSAFGMGPMISYFNVHMSEPLRYGKRNG